MNSSTIDIDYVIERLEQIHTTDDSKEKWKQVRLFLEECIHNRDVDNRVQNKLTANIDKFPLEVDEYDAEILIISDGYMIGDEYSPKEIIGKMGFHCGWDLSMYADPREEKLATFIANVLATAHHIRNLYEQHPDVTIHVQVRFNFSHVNV